jgi:hypothetical protein
MYEYRVLFPRVGANELRRDLARIAAAAERRRNDGCVRPEQRTRKARS